MAGAEKPRAQRARIAQKRTVALYPYRVAKRAEAKGIGGNTRKETHERGTRNT